MPKTDIELPNPGSRDPRLPRRKMPQQDRPLMEFDKRRADREMTRPIVSRSVGGKR